MENQTETKQQLEENYKKFLEYQEKKTKRALRRASLGVLMIFGGLGFIWYKTDWSTALALFIMMWGANIENKSDEDIDYNG